MNIVIVGAGSIGYYLAKLLSKKRINVTVIDKSIDSLELISRKLDVATQLGDATNWNVLEALSEDAFLITVTEEDEKNLIISCMGKHLGFKRTIARVRNEYYLDESRLHFKKIFCVDHIIGPEILVADELRKCMTFSDSQTIERFVHGIICMRTLKVPENWDRSILLKDLSLPTGLMLGLIARKDADGKELKIIFPHGEDKILPQDEVTIIGKTDAVYQVDEFFNLEKKTLRSVVIYGGSMVGFHLAKMLIRRNIQVKLIENSYERCCELAEIIPEAIVIHNSGVDIPFLESEHVDNAEYFVVCGRNDEHNMAISMMAKKLGCKRVMSVISQPKYDEVAEMAGVDHVRSPRISTANAVLSLLQKKKIHSVISMYDDQAEVIETRISTESKLAGVPIHELSQQLPRDFLFGVIQSKGQIRVANGFSVLSPGDTVIIVSAPNNIDELEQQF